MYGSDQLSRVIASHYIDGSYVHVNVWVSLLGAAALLSIFFLLHTRTRFYTATLVATTLGLDSLSALTIGDRQTLLVPLLSLACSIIVLLGRKPNRTAPQLDASAPVDARLLERSV